MIREGLANDFVRHVGQCRKAAGCQYTDRVQIGVVTDSRQLKAAIEEHQSYIMSETLAVKLVFGPLPDVAPTDVEIAGSALKIHWSISPCL